MKILLIVPEYPPYNIGGGGGVFKEIAENLSSLGNNVYVIYGYYPNTSIFPKIELNEINNIKFYKVPEVPCPKFLPFLKTVLPIFPWTYFQLKQIIKDIDPEVVNIHGYGLFFISQAALILKSLNIPYVYTLHGAPVSPGKMKGIIGLIYKFYNKFLGRNTLKHASKITAVSKYSRNFPEFETFKNKIQIIRNGISIDEFRDLKYTTRNVFNKFFPYSRDELIFFSLGRIEWLKGFQLFMQIIPLLKQDGIKLKYCIAGKDNGYLQELKKLAADLNIENEVIFLDYLNFQEKCECYYFSDFVVVPSLVENFPAIPLEAMCMKKLVIANNAGGIPEIIQNNYNGIIVDMNERQLLYTQIKELLSNPKLKIEIESHLHEVEKYNWVEITNKYLDTFKSVINKL